MTVTPQKTTTGQQNYPVPVHLAGIPDSFLCPCLGSNSTRCRDRWIDNGPLTTARVFKERENETQISSVLSAAIQIKGFGEGRWD